MSVLCVISRCKALLRLRPPATAASSQVVLLGATGLRLLTSLVLTMVLGRCLSVEEFGYFALVATAFALAHEFTDLGTGNIAIRHAAQDPASERRMLESLLGLHLVTSGIAALGCIALALSQDSLLHRAILFAAAAIIVLCHFNGLSTVFQLRQAQLAPAVLSVLVGFGVLAGSFVLLAFQATGAMFATLVLWRELAMVIGIRALALRLLGYAPYARLRGDAMRPFAGKAMIIALSTLFYHLLFQGGFVLVQYVRPAAELGAFAAAVRPITPLLFVPWILMLPLVPLLSWLATARRDRFRAQAQGALHLSIGCGAVIAVGLGHLAPALLEVLFGGKFSDGALSSVAALRWMSVALGCAFVNAVIATALLADSRERQLLPLTFVGFVVYCLVNLILLPKYHFTGSAIATTLAAGATSAGGLLLLARGPQGLTPGRETLIFISPAATLFALLYFLPGPALTQLALGSILVGLAMIAVWHLPGVARYRAEQADLSLLAQPDRGATSAPLGADA